jgi:hypothetical protein
MNKKHFIIYYKQGTGTFITTEPRPWSRENQRFFPNYQFTNNNDSPRTKAIEDFLIANYGFIVFENPDVKVLFNFDTNINL